MKWSNPTFLTVLLFVGGAVLRLMALDGQSLWNDEMFSLKVASLPIAQIPGQLSQSYFHPPLYFLLLHFMVKWFGTGEWSLRFLSAVIGSLTVPALFLITEKWFDKRTALWASVFCLVAPFHVAYSQEARPYALAAFLSLLSVFTLQQAWTKKRAQNYIAYSLVTTAALYTHHWVIFLVVAEITYVIIDGLLHRESMKLPLLSWFGIGVLYAPLLSTVVLQTERVTNAPWWWAEPASLSHLLWAHLAFTGVYFKLASGVFTSPLPIEIIGGALVFTVLAVALWTVVRKDERIARAVLFSLFGTLALAFVVSTIRPETFLWYRYPVIVFPFFCIVLGFGLTRFRGAPLRIILGGVLILMMVVNTYRYYHWPKGNTKSVAAYVSSIASEKSDVVIRPAYFEELFNYYYHGRAQQVDEGPFDSLIGPAIQHADRFVLITLDIPNELRDYIDSHFEKVMERKFPGEAHMGVVVGVYRKNES